MSMSVPYDVRTRAIMICREAAAQPEILNTYEGVAAAIGYDPKGPEVALATAAYAFVADEVEDDVSVEDTRAAAILAQGWTPREPRKERV